MRHFCTLFDSGYLTRGLALYESLKAHCQPFTLHVLTMDDEAHEILREFEFPEMRLIRLAELEAAEPELLRVKSSRSWAEYCWTLTPCVPLHVINANPSIDLISYVDADCYFFSDPSPMFVEMSSAPALIIEHRFSPNYASLQNEAGRFNVGVVGFRATIEGREILEWWKARCLEWCHARFENGKYGDQLYLDKFPELFPKTHVLRHPGGGVGPWNVWRYRLRRSADAGPIVDGAPVVFYHFHGFKAFENGGMTPSSAYRFSSLQVELFYEAYTAAIMRAAKLVSGRRPNFRKGFHQPEPAPRTLSELRYAASSMLKSIKSRILGADR